MNYKLSCVLCICNSDKETFTQTHHLQRLCISLIFLCGTMQASKMVVLDVNRLFWQVKLYELCSAIRDLLNEIENILSRKYFVHTLYFLTLNALQVLGVWYQIKNQICMSNSTTVHADVIWLEFSKLCGHYIVIQV